MSDLAVEEPKIYLSPLPEVEGKRCEKYGKEKDILEGEISDLVVRTKQLS